MYKPELLLPAGSFSRMQTAFLYGADAVYAGLPSLSLRARSGFTLEELVEGIKYAHDNGKKVYLALNLFTKNKDVEKLPDFLKTIMTVAPDGVIVSDPGVVEFIKQNAPTLPIHISTQANICSYLTLQFWEKMGAERAVLAREISFDEMKEIRQKCPNIELEAFIHGAMCMSYSGRCLLSAFMANRSANQGACAHSCRWKYKMHVKRADGSSFPLEVDEKNQELVQFFLEEEQRQGEFLEIIEDEHGSYIMNSKDMCLMPRLGDFLDIGVNSLKIEGRNKSEYYAAIAARAYRHAIDSWLKDKENFDPAPFMAELETLQNRGYTMAFHDGIPDDSAQNYVNTASKGEWHTCGYIDGYNADGLLFVVRNPYVSGDVLDIISPYQFEPVKYKVNKIIFADNGMEVEKASPGLNRKMLIPWQDLGISKDDAIKLFPKWTFLRKKIK